MSFPSPRLLGAVLLLLAMPATAQEALRVVPATFAPGALLRLDGRGLQAAREVAFLASAGDDLRVARRPLKRGPAGEWLVVAPALRDAEGAPLDGPWAWLAVDGAAPLPVFLFEGAGGQVRAAGSGSQLAGGRRLTASFDLAGGPPLPGNAGFTLELHEAPPGAAAFAAVGPPRELPWPRAGDATLVTDVTRALLLGPVAVGADGSARVALPVPALAGAELAVQWLVHEPASGAPLFSDALLVAL